MFYCRQYLAIEFNLSGKIFLSGPPDKGKKFECNFTPKQENDFGMYLYKRKRTVFCNHILYLPLTL